MHDDKSPIRRWPHRLIAALAGCFLSAFVVVLQIPAGREAIGIANSIYRFIDSTVPALGVTAIWISFVLIVGGVLATWRLSRGPNEGMAKMMTEGSAVLTVALGVLVALVASLNVPTPLNVAPRSKHHHRSDHHRHRRHTPAQRTSAGSSTSAAGGASSAKPASSPASAPTSAESSPSPSQSSGGGAAPPPSSGGSSSTSGGGGGNTVTLNKTNSQNAQTGNAEGSEATSGPATNNNTESTNISIG